MKRRVLSQETPRKEMRFLRGERTEVGIDMHKRSHNVALWSEQHQAVVARWVQPAGQTGSIERLSPHKGRIDHAVHGAGPTSYNLVLALREGGFQSDVTAPSRTPKGTG